MFDVIKINNLLGKDVKELLSVRYVIELNKNKECIEDILFYVKNSRLYAEALGSHKLSISSIACAEGEGVFFNILASELVEINKLIKAKSDVYIEIDKKNETVNFGVDGVVVNCGLVPSTGFLSFNKLFTEGNRFKLILNKSEVLPLLKELNKVNMPNKEAKRVCNISILNNELTMTVRGVETVSRVVKCECEQNVNMSFNLKYLIEMLNSIKDKEIVLELKGETDPIIYKGINKKDMLHPIKDRIN